MADTESKILTRTEDGVGWLTINNAEQRNCISHQMRIDMVKALSDFEASDEVRVAVISGAGGKSFTSGNDIAEFERFRSDPDLSRLYDDVSYKARVGIRDFTKPLVSMIQGYCMGGGVGMALITDLRFASESSQFAIPAGRLGIAYSLENLRALSAVVGVAFAKEFLFTGRLFSSGEAQQIGLVNAVVPDGDLLDHVRGVTRRIAAGAPLTMKASKLALTEISMGGALDRLADIEAANRACEASADVVEGRRAFMEKRPPVFGGR